MQPVLYEGAARLSTVSLSMQSGSLQVYICNCYCTRKIWYDLDSNIVREREKER